MLDNLIKSKGRELNSAASSIQNLTKQEKIAKNNENATSSAMRREVDALTDAIQDSEEAESFDLDIEATSEIEMTSPDGEEAIEVPLPEASEYAKIRDEFLTGIVYDPSFSLEAEDQYFTDVLEALENPPPSFTGGTFFTDENGIILTDDNGNGLGLDDLEYPEENWEAFKWICTFFLAYLSGKETKVAIRRVMGRTHPSVLENMLDSILELPYHKAVSSDDICAVTGKNYRDQEVLLDVDTEEGRNILRKRLEKRILDPNLREELLGHVDLLDPNRPVFLPDGTRDVTCDPENIPSGRRQEMLSDIRNALKPRIDLTTEAGREAAAEKLRNLHESGDTGRAGELADRIDNLRTTDDPIQEAETVALNSLNDWGVNVDVSEILEKLESLVDSIATDHPDTKTRAYRLIKLWAKRQLSENGFDTEVLKLLKGSISPTKRANFDTLLTIGCRVIFKEPVSDSDWGDVWGTLDDLLDWHFVGDDLLRVRQIIQVLMPRTRPDSMLNIAGDLETEFESILTSELADPRAVISESEKERAQRALSILRHESRTKEEEKEYRITLNTVFKKLLKSERIDRYREIAHVVAGSDFLFDPYLQNLETQFEGFYLPMVADEEDKDTIRALYRFLIHGEVGESLQELWVEKINDLFHTIEAPNSVELQNLVDGGPRAYLTLGSLVYYLIHDSSMEDYGSSHFPERFIAIVAEGTDLGVTNSRETELDSMATALAGSMTDSSDAFQAWLALKQGEVNTSELSVLDGNIQALIPSLLTPWDDFKSLFNTAYDAAKSQSDNPDTRRMAPASISGIVEQYLGEYISIESGTETALTGNVPDFRTTRKPTNFARAPEIFHGAEVEVGGAFTQTRSYQVIRDPKYQLVGGDEFFRRIRTFAGRDSKISKEGNRVSQQINKFRTHTTGRVLTKTQDIRADAFRVQQDILFRMSSGVSAISDKVASVLCLMDGLHDLIKVMNGAIADIANVARDILKSASFVVQDIRNALKAIQQTLLSILRTLSTLLRTRMKINCACLSVNFGSGLDLGFFGLDGLPNWITGAFPTVPDPFDFLNGLLNDFQNFLTLDPKLGCPQNIINSFGGNAAISDVSGSIFS